MTYNKAFFVFISGICIMFFIIFCMMTKMFFLKDFVCALVLVQISLLGYLVGVTIFDLKKMSKKL